MPSLIFFSYFHGLWLYRFIYWLQMHYGDDLHALRFAEWARFTCSILLLLFCFGTRRRKHLPTIYLRKENRPWLCVVLYPLLKFRFGSVVLLEYHFPSSLFQEYILDRREHTLWKKGIYALAAPLGCEPLDGKWRSEIWPQGGLLVLHKVNLALWNDTESPFQSFLPSVAPQDEIEFWAINA
jgi:hypothetical protein